MKILLAAALTLFTAPILSAEEPRAFEISPRADHRYQIQAPAPGHYRLYLRASTPKAGTTHFARLILDNGVPMRRRIILPTQRQSQLEVERIAFNREPRELRLTDIPPDVTIEKLIFQPVVFPLPEAARQYRPDLTPPQHHPRLLINPASLEKVRAHLELGDHAAVWNAVRTVAEKPFPFTPSTTQETGYDASLLAALRAKAFHYLVRNDRKIGREAVELAHRYLTSVNLGNGQDICRATGETIYTGALVYDWCYPLMTDAERDDFRERFLFLAEGMETGWPPFLEPVTVGHANEAQMSRDLLAMAIAVYDEDPLPWQYLAYAFREIFAPAKTQPARAGRHHQGSGYGSYRFSWDLFAAAHFRRTFGLELLPEATGKIPYYWIYLRTPVGGILTEGDATFTERYYGNTQMNLLSAALWPDAKLQAEFASLCPNPEKFSDPVLYLLFHDPELVPDFRRDDLPLIKFFDHPRPGMIVRTGWNTGRNADDVVVMVNGGGVHYRNHQHLDAGAFQIYYRGLLAVDLGQYNYYGTAYDWNFAKSSLSHSVLRLIDPEQKKRAMGSQFTVNSGTQEVSGWDGPATLEEELHDPRHQIGRTLRQGAGPEPDRPLWAFLESDLAAAYPGRAVHYTRSAVFLNFGTPDTPAALLIFDRLATAAPRIRPVFQLTTLSRPEQQDGVLAVRQKPYARSGKLAILPLLPQRAQIAVLSGNDAHTFDGVYLTPPYPASVGADGSRTEITAADGEDASRFLVVLPIQEGNAPTPKALLEDDHERVNVRLKNYLIGFGDARQPTAREVAFALPSPGKALLLDLASGEWQLTHATETLGKVSITPENGCFFAELAAGNYRLIPGADTSLRPLPPSGGPAPEVAPPASEKQLYLDDVLLAEPPASLKYIPFTALLRARGIEFQNQAGKLQCRIDGMPLTLTEKNKELRFGHRTVELPSPVLQRDGTWLLDPTAAAGLLNLDYSVDAATGSLFFHSRKTPAPLLCLQAGYGAPDAWLRFFDTGRGMMFLPAREVSITATFKQPQNLNGVSLRFQRQRLNTARNPFRIEISTDGKNFETVFDGAGPDRDSDFVRYDFAPREVAALRLVIHNTAESARNQLSGLILHQVPSAQLQRQQKP